MLSLMQAEIYEGKFKVQLPLLMLFIADCSVSAQPFVFLWLRVYKNKKITS